MCYHESSTNLVVLLQFLYLHEEKFNLSYVSTPRVPISSLDRGAGSSTRKRSGFVPNVKPHLFPVNDFVTQLISDVFWFFPLAKLNTRISNYIYLGVARLRFQMEEILEQIKLGFDPQESFT